MRSIYLLLTFASLVANMASAEEPDPSDDDVALQTKHEHNEKIHGELRQLRDDVGKLNERLTEIESLVKNLQPKPLTARPTPPRPHRHGKPQPKLFWDRLADPHKQEILDAERTALQPLRSWSLSEEWTVWGVTIADDNRTVLAGGSVGEWRLGDITTGNLNFALEQMELQQILSVGVSPDGKTIALGSAKGLHLLSRNSPSEERFFAFPQFVKTLDFSNDGRLIAIAGGHPTVLVLRTTDLTVAYEIATKASAVTNVRLSNDGRRIAIASGQIANHKPDKEGTEALKESGIWDLATGLPLFLVPGNWRGSATLVQELLPARSFLVSEPDGMFTWVLAEQNSRQRIGEPRQQALDISRDGASVLVDIDDRKLGIYDIPSKQFTQTLDIPRHWRFCACLSPDGRFIAAGGSDGGIRVWEIKPTEE